jgi:hypothetical protein
MNHYPIGLFAAFDSPDKAFHFHTLTFLTFAKLNSGLAKRVGNLTPSLQVARTFFNKLTAAQRFHEQLNRSVLCRRYSNDLIAWIFKALVAPTLSCLIVSKSHLNDLFLS